MHISVIISTYNHPKWLQKVLYGYLHQTFTHFELIIADDGSSKETSDVVDSFQKQNPQIKLKHLWHPDEGFRKTRILNKAIIESSYDYLLVTDGDCIPRKDFLNVHKTLAEPGHFLSGGYCKLPLDLSRLITREDIQNENAFSSKWLKSNGKIGFSQTLKLSAKEPFSHLLDSTTSTKATWNGMNSSGYKKDLLAVNGFNESMEYGGLDRELGERLFNLGLKGKQIRHRAVCLHLDHKRGYKDPELVTKNQELRQQIIDQQIIWCPDGIKKTANPND